jgi:hypothetical protein
MDFVQSLRPEHLQSFWYSASKYCFALIGTFVSLLWITAQDKEEAAGYKEKLDEYRWTLRLSSKSADFLERAISMLATSTGILVKAIPVKPNTEYFLNRHKNMITTSISTTAAAAPENSSYAQPDFQESETETHEEFTANGEDTGETPSTSGVAGGDYMSDHLWFASNTRIGDFDAVYGEAGSAMQPPYLGIADTANGYEFQSFAKQGPIGESSSRVP